MPRSFMTGINACLRQRCCLMMFIVSTVFAPVECISPTDDGLGVPKVDVQAPETDTNDKWQRSFEMDPSGIIKDESSKFNGVADGESASRDRARGEIRDERMSHGRGDSQGDFNAFVSSDVNNAASDAAPQAVGGVVSGMHPQAHEESADGESASHDRARGEIKDERMSLERGDSQADFNALVSSDVSKAASEVAPQAAGGVVNGVRPEAHEDAGVVHGMHPEAQEDSGVVHGMQPAAIDDSGAVHSESAARSPEESATEAEDAGSSNVESLGDLGTDVHHPSMVGHVDAESDPDTSIKVESVEVNSKDRSPDVPDLRSVTPKAQVAAVSNEAPQNARAPTPPASRSLRHRPADDIALSSGADSQVSGTVPSTLVTAAPSHISTAHVWPLSVLNLLLIAGMRYMCWRRQQKPKRSPEDILAEVYEAAARERKAQTSKMVRDML